MLVDSPPFYPPPGEMPPYPFYYNPGMPPNYGEYDPSSLPKTAAYPYFVCPPGAMPPYRMPYSTVPPQWAPLPAPENASTIPSQVHSKPANSISEGAESEDTTKKGKNKTETAGPIKDFKGKESGGYAPY